MSYVLGIDIGSSKVAAVIVELESGKTVDAVSILHAADSSDEVLFSEQDPTKLLSSVDAAISGLPYELRQKVRAVGVCGQMHGVVLWKDANQDNNSQLITWQDQRTAGSAFLSVLRKTSGQENVHPGFGIVTLAWLEKYQSDWLAEYAHSGTIMDFFVARICGLAESVIDRTNAASWGFYDTDRGDWNYDAVETVNVSKELLPRIVKTGTKVGYLHSSIAERWQIPARIPVCVACGDSPAAVYSAKEHIESGCYLNLGTGGQLGVVVDAGSLADYGDLPNIDVRPFPGNKELVVTTSQCGGKAFLWLVETVDGWLSELGVEGIPRDTLFETLTKLGMKRPEQDLPVFLPYFTEERHAPGLLGSINGIAEGNFSLASITRSLAKGMVAPLFERMPVHLLEGKIHVIGTGNGIRRSKLVQELVEDICGMDLIMPEIIEEAASGAARLAGDSLRLSR